MKSTPPPGKTVRKRSVAGRFGRIAAWVVGIPLVLFAALYLVLLIRPLPLPFLATQLRNIVVSALPPGSELELGDMALAIEGFAWPVIQFSPVVFKDTTSGGKVRMEAFELGFSPLRALIGQPGVSVTMVAPHIQINQDLFGPRLAELEVVPDPAGGIATVRVLEGTSAFPDATFRPDGINITGETTEATHVRSDNDWLVFNLEAMQTAIASVIEQAEMGRFSRFVIKRGTVDMNDALYQTLRTFRNIDLDVAPTPDGRAVEGDFVLDFADMSMNGIFERMIDDSGDARLMMSLNNFDLTAFAPVINDESAAIGIVGPSAVSLDLGFDAVTGKIKEGIFRVDVTGTDLRIDGQYFPIASNIMRVDWVPSTGTMTMSDASLSVGDSTMRLNGTFAMGLDELYGPTVGMSMTASDIVVRGEDIGEPEAPFEMSFQGWSAPLYGAVGVDKAIMTSPGGMRIESRGRIDMLRRGIGFDMTIAGEGATADELKRIWPYFIASDARNWFVKNVVGGRVESANMKYSFPAGTLGLNGEDRPVPQNGIFIEMVAEGVQIKPTDQMDPITITGKTRLQMHDSDFTVAGDGGVIATERGNVSIANAALVMSPNTPEESIVEISGDISGGFPAIADVVDQIQPGMLESESMPVDVAALTGSINVRLLSTTLLDQNGATKVSDFSITGNVQDFGTGKPIEGVTLKDGHLSFMATQDAFRIGGTANLQGMDTEVVVEGDLTTGAATPPMTISASVDLADLAKLGVDVSDFGSGKVTLEAKPQSDGAIAVVADLKAASINIKDLGITKSAGQAGLLKATIRQKGDETDITGLDLAFGSVRLRGSLQADAKRGLRSAEFSNFAMSEGDAAQVSVTPLKDGFAVRIRGSQLDAKPLLKRFFDLNQGSGGVEANSVPTTIALDAELDRVLGMYQTTAYNLNLDMTLRGSDMRNVSLQTQLNNNSSVSIATNPTSDGRTMTIVFNDLGSLLRLVGVYPQVQGGEGTFVLATNTADKVDRGTISLKNFAIVDEKNVATLMAGQTSRNATRGGDTMEFNSARVNFLRRVDRIQIIDALLNGDSIGGSGEGFIYTDRKQYDLVGTLIPMFGINNAFGRLFGGGNTGGLFGVTFAVNGPLDKPAFRVNPLSALAPGAFRNLFEYRAKEQPRVD